MKRQMLTGHDSIYTVYYIVYGWSQTINFAGGGSLCYRTYYGNIQTLSLGAVAPPVMYRPLNLHWIQIFFDFFWGVGGTTCTACVHFLDSGSFFSTYIHVL
jgi:hypothetical protein